MNASFTVINFYKFIELTGEELSELAESMRFEAAARRLFGTILLAPEGINVGLSGSDENLDDFVAWLCRDPRFADVAPKVSKAETKPFRRLMVKVKPWIIRFAEDEDPSVEEVKTGARLSPEELCSLIESKAESLVLVDTRNAYEVEYGSFEGAVNLEISRFTEFPDVFESKFGTDKDKTFVFFCTGGVRCEKVVPWAKRRGFQKSYQLDGGILGYFQACGTKGYDGRCFVFDDRWAVDGALREAGDLVPAQSETATSRSS